VIENKKLFTLVDFTQNNSTNNVNVNQPNIVDKNFEDIFLDNTNSDDNTNLKETKKINKSNIEISPFLKKNIPKQNNTQNINKNKNLVVDTKQKNNGIENKNVIINAQLKNIDDETLVEKSFFENEKLKSVFEIDFISEYTIASKININNFYQILEFVLSDYNTYSNQTYKKDYAMFTIYDEKKNIFLINQERLLFKIKMLVTSSTLKNMNLFSDKKIIFSVIQKMNNIMKLDIGEQLFLSDTNNEPLVTKKDIKLNKNIFTQRYISMKNFNSFSHFKYIIKIKKDVNKFDFSE
jgi:hypothetical protein